MIKRRYWTVWLILWLAACSPSEGPAAIVPSPTAPIEIAQAPALPATPLPPTATSLPTSTPIPQTYTVQAGDVLGSIAQKFEISVEALAQANHITDYNLIHVGDILIIPRGDVPADNTSATPTSTRASG